jgi:hypothetical protein
MPKIESPIGNRSFNQKGMREFNVPDESGYDDSIPYNVDTDSIRKFQSKLDNFDEDESVSEIENQFYKAREIKKGKEKIGESAKRRIEMLIGMTLAVKEVTIDQNTFTLKTLKSKEMREALSASSQFDGSLETPYEIRKQILARALTHIAGVEIEQFISSSSLEAKLNFIDELDDSFIGRLYKEYTILSDENQRKYGIKTDSDVKEVFEDIKK